MKLVETQFSARLRLGDVGDVIGELEAAVATYPFQEGLWELLITALYRAGRQADALGDVPAGPAPVGRRARPRPRTAAAAARAADPGPRRVARRPDRTARARLDRPRGTCRRCRSSSSDASRRWPRCATCSPSTRLVEIVGPGGIGKTAVAIATGRTLTESTRCRGAVASGWRGSNPRRRPTRSSTRLIAALNVTGGEAALFERLKGSAALVILDNCEHVVDAAAALAVRLLDAAPGLRILCTSQVPLDVDGEAVFELAPLALVRRRRVVHPSRQRATQATKRVGAADDAVHGALPFARRSAAGDRARRGAHQDVVDRGDHPPPRRPLHRVAATRPAADRNAAER